MKQFSKLMLIALSFGIVTLALSLVPSKPAGAAGSAPVTVTHTPLPVTLQGTEQISGNVNVSVVNSASSPVPIKNAAAGPLTHTGRLPSEHVILQLNVFTPTAPTPQYFRVFPDGTVDVTPFVIPKGSSLIVTDVDWEKSGGPPGFETVIEFRFGSQNDPSGFICLSTGQYDIGGFAGKSEHMTSGLVLTKVPPVTLGSSSNLAKLIIRGYLAPSE